MSVRLGIAAGVVVGGVVTALLVVTGTGSGTPRVTITISYPCRNPQPLIIGDHAWWTTEAAPLEWGNGDERGTFTVIRTGEAVFRSDADGKQLALHESPSRFTMLNCGVGGSTPMPGVAAPIAIAGSPGVVPSVVGMNAESAAESLGGAGFRLAMYHVRSENVTAGVVISQEPPASAQASKGDIVTITVSDGP